MNNDSKLIWEQYNEPKKPYSILTHLDFIRSITPQLNEALNKAIQECEDPAERTSLSNGHGIYVGSCGHVIKQCRCMKRHEPIVVQTLCENCTQSVTEAYYKAEQFKLDLPDTASEKSNKKDRETRTYSITCKSEYLDKLELFFRWINNTAGGHSGTAALSIDGDGSPRFKIEKNGGELHKDPDNQECSDSKPTPEYHISIA